MDFKFDFKDSVRCQRREIGKNLCCRSRKSIKKVYIKEINREMRLSLLWQVGRVGAENVQGMTVKRGGLDLISQSDIYSGTIVHS